MRETIAVAGNESTSASYYAPVLGFLARVQAPPASPVRVEVPLTRSHWEAALLAPTVSLARGWEKQLDTRYDEVLLEPGLTAAGYSRWLHEQAVSYVALPDTPLDPSSAQEGRLIRRGLPYPADGVHEQALDRLCGARPDAAAGWPRAADLARPRLLRAARRRAGELPRAGAVHALLDVTRPAAGSRLSEAPGRLDLCDG